MTASVPVVLLVGRRRHGFVVSPPDGASDTTCFKPEPWHLRDVGPDVAAAVEASGLSLREYLLRP